MKEGNGKNEEVGSNWGGEKSVQEKEGVTKSTPFCWSIKPQGIILFYICLKLFTI